MTELPRDIKLAPGEEFCTEVLGSGVTIIVQSGLVENYGSPLDVGVPYYFTSGAMPLLKSSINAQNDSVLQINGKYNILGNAQNCVYTSDIVDFLEFLNVKRDGITQSCLFGPVVLVCGKRGVGKSRFCRMLCNAAVHEDFHVEYIDLNTENNSIALPRHLCATTVQDFFPPSDDIEPRFPTVLPYDDLTLPHNHTDKRWPIFEKILKKMFAVYKAKASLSDKLRRGGMVIEIPAHLYPESEKTESSSISEALISTVQIFGAQHLCILDNADASLQTLNIFRSSHIQKECTFHRFPFLSTQSVRLSRFIESSNDKICKYFLGSSSKLKCFRIRVSYTNIHFYHTELHGNTIQAREIDITENFREYISRIASVLDVEEDTDILLSNTIGFVLIVEIDTTRKEMDLVVPSPEVLPTNHILVTGTSTTAPELLCS